MMSILKSRQSMFMVADERRNGVQVRHLQCTCFEAVSFDFRLNQQLRALGDPFDRTPDETCSDAQVGKSDGQEWRVSLQTHGIGHRRKVGKIVVPSTINGGLGRCWAHDSHEGHEPCGKSLLSCPGLFTILQHRIEVMSTVQSVSLPTGHTNFGKPTQARDLSAQPRACIIVRTSAPRYF
jgi:hypothetical protein